MYITCEEDVLGNFVHSSVKIGYFYSAYPTILSSLKVSLIYKFLPGFLRPSLSLV